MRRAFPRLVLLSALLASVALPVPAHAQPEQAPAGAPSPDAVQRADALFRSANHLYTEKKWAEAEAGFLAAWALNPTYDVAANLGHAQFKLQKYRDAAEHLSFALRNWPLIGKPEPRKLAQDRLDDARRLVAAVTVRVSEPGADVLVDGKLVGHSPIAFELFVEPGTRVFEARLPGHGEAKKVVQTVKGGASTVTLTLSQPGGTPPGGGGTTAPVSLPASAGPSKAVVIAGGTVTGVALVTGIVLAVVASSKGADASTKLAMLQQAGNADPCPTNGSTCSTINSDRGTQDRLSNVSMGVFIGAGAVGLATLGYALFAPKARPARGLRVLPALGAGQGGVVVTGAW